MLMQVLEVQEKLEDGVDTEEVEVLKRENEGRIEKSVGLLGRLIEEGRWEEAGKECIRLRYWMSVKEGLNEWQEGGGGVVLVH
jgi:molecular chaperone HscB